MHSTYVVAWFVLGCGVGGLTGWVCTMRAEQRWWRAVRSHLLTDARARYGTSVKGDLGTTASAPICS